MFDFKTSFVAVLLLAVSSVCRAQVPSIDLSRQNANVRSEVGALIGGAARTTAELARQQAPVIRNEIIRETYRTIAATRRGTEFDRQAAIRRRQFDFLKQQQRLNEINAERPHSDSNPPIVRSQNSPLPEGFSETDVAAFDLVFGRFNPLRLNVSAVSTASWSETLQYAARHRRAELSSLRDEAFQANDLESLLRIRRMEIALNAMVQSSLAGGSAQQLANPLIGQ